MGSSTRNKYPRGNKLLLQGISDGSISLSGHGLVNIFNDLFFSKNGVSKPKKTLQERLYSSACKNSITGLGKLSKKIKAGNFAAIGFSKNISLYSNGEKAEIFCEYLGIDNDELLKTSFKESITGIDLINENFSIAELAAIYIKNIISNVFKEYTLEDSLDNLTEMTEELYEIEVDDFSNKRILPIIQVEMDELNFDDEDKNGFQSISSAFDNIMLKLRRVGDHDE